MSESVSAEPSRRRVRIRAMQWLYQLEIRGELAEEDTPSEDEGAAADERVLDQRARPLARAAWADRETIDRLVAEASPQWPPARQPAVDRAIIRLALHEMRSGYCPVPAAINEAIELAKTYGGAESPRFVNGVLDRVAADVQGTPRPSGAAEAGEGPPTASG